ncbi:MAG: hypothetical protein KDA42_16500 [Planctomycetales bacterium]|nr:hypothetical protein [Planctomycetales bacterium]
MDYDGDKIDDVVLALLALTMHSESEFGSRAWKCHAWAVLDRLHGKGFIGDPRSKAKSVIVTPEGVTRVRELFDQLFARGSG